MSIKSLNKGLAFDGLTFYFYWPLLIKNITTKLVMAKKDHFIAIDNCIIYCITSIITRGFD